MSAAVPHEKIREDEDRSFTFVLLARLAEPDLPEDERDEIATTLECLDAPRAEEETTRRALGQPRWNPRNSGGQGYARIPAPTEEDLAGQGRGGSRHQDVRAGTCPGRVRTRPPMQNSRGARRSGYDGRTHDEHRRPAPA